MADQKGIRDRQDQNITTGDDMPEKQFDETSFWNKLTTLPQQAGCQVIKLAITLFVILTSTDAPKSTRAIIITALAYFIFPLDAIPDFLPGGYIDDIAVMSGVLAKVNSYLNADLKAKIAEYMPERCL